MSTPQDGNFKIDRKTLLKGIQCAVPAAKETDAGILLHWTGVELPDGKWSNLLSNEEIEEIIENLKTATLTEASVEWSTYAEFSLLSLSPGGLFEDYFEENSIVGSGEHPIKYTVGIPSKEFLSYLLCEAAQIPAEKRAKKWRFMRIRTRHIAARLKDQAAAQDLGVACALDVIAQATHTISLRIESPKIRTDYEDLANSFLFHAAYNLDAAARIGRDPIFQEPVAQRYDRTQAGSLDAPRQWYEKDLVHHYLMGVAAEIPLLEFLAHYHIAEHFFEKVFNDDLVNTVRKEITDPGFSVRRAKDIQNVIKTIRDAQRQVREEGGVNELKALKLTFEKFVTLRRLIADLNSYDASLIDYYKANRVSFADAEKVDLLNPDEQVVFKALAARVYKVRNSLVHAKEGRSPRYAPFAHDVELSKEIPIMRFAAEQIIIAQGKLI
ncbi:hypothetical protein [Streptomyces sp. OR43]|uniref:hypothetical protein n=1 Tax=Streptomyces sp. or43 TaxID=2478957 RepID=UPI0011CD4666|nr:hypothetical protein [Streptomyces sp. or43]